MLLLLLTIVILLIPATFFGYRYNKDKKEKYLYPFQKKVIQTLINDIKTSKIDVILSKKGPEESSMTLTLFEAKKIAKNKRRELANEKYNDYQLFFADDSSQILDFGKYIGNRFLPKEVATELRPFYNTRYSKVEPSGTYMMLITDISQENSAAEKTNKSLASGNGEAFKSWSDFKENASRLNFAISRWIWKNCDLEDASLFQHLDTIGHTLK